MKLTASPLCLSLTLTALLLPLSSRLHAGVDSNTPPSAIVAAAGQEAPKPAPLPLHQIEGSGGLVTTLSAYIVNPQRQGQVVGLPAAGFAFVDMGHGKNIEATTLTESPISRLEIGYGWDHMCLGNLAPAIRSAGVSTYTQNEVNLQNANLRFQLVKENDFNQKWLPALTLGVHYKYNGGISEVNQQLGGALNAAGITHNSGVDVTLYASKTITQLPIPIMINVGGRATEAVWDGFGGFTDHYNFVFEGNVIIFPTSHLALGAEFKQQPKDYQAIGNLVQMESNWWTLDAAYVITKNLTVAVSYGHFGNVLNSSANGTWGLTTKWEF